MMTFTESGIALIGAAVTSGIQIHFERIELIADPKRSADSLTYDVEIVSVSKRDTKTVILKAVTDNAAFTGDYFFNKLNVYASADGGQELLLCYQHTETCPVYIPAFDGRSVQSEIEVYVTVGDAALVHLTHDGVYVLQTDFVRMQEELNQLRTKVSGFGRVLVGAPDTELFVNDTLYVVDGMPERLQAAAFSNMVFSTSAPTGEKYWAELDGTEDQAEGTNGRSGGETITSGKLVVAEEEPEGATFYAKIIH